MSKGVCLPHTTLPWKFDIQELDAKTHGVEKATFYNHDDVEYLWTPKTMKNEGF